MRFRLVPKSVTLNYPEGRNGHYVALFFIILNPGHAVLLAIAEFLVRNLHIAVARILSISSAFLLPIQWLVRMAQR